MMCSHTPETTRPMAKPASPEVRPPTKVETRKRMRDAGDRPSMGRSRSEAAGAWMAMHLKGRLRCVPGNEYTELQLGRNEALHLRPLSPHLRGEGRGEGCFRKRTTRG